MSAAPASRQLLYVVLDGLGDEPAAALGGQTPLEAALTPVLDGLARGGEVFRLDMRDRAGEVSTSHGQFALMGYPDDGSLPHRGPVEAAGIGVALDPGDVALRANFATFGPGGSIVDRRAGRIRAGADALAAALDGLDLGGGVRALVKSGTEHRVALVLRGADLGAAVSDSDPMHAAGARDGAMHVTALEPGDAASERTAEKLRLLLARAREILAVHPVNDQRRASGLLPANGLLVRKAGVHVPVQPLIERYGLRCLAVTGDCTVRGVMRLIGSEIVSLPEFTANSDTDLPAKFAQAVSALRQAHDVVMVHVKAVDILSHDRLPAEARALIERLDTSLGAALAEYGDDLIVAVAADHSTSSSSGDHIALPPPALVSGPGIGSGGAVDFSERAVLAVEAPMVTGAQFFDRLRERLVAAGRASA